MKFSDGRVSFLSHRILERLREENLAEIESERHALAVIKRAFAQHREREAAIDQAVRRKIESLSRRVLPGSREWDVLYRKYFEEEERRLRRLSRP